MELAKHNRRQRPASLAVNVEVSIIIPSAVGFRVVLPCGFPRATHARLAAMASTHARGDRIRLPAPVRSETGAIPEKVVA